MNRESLSPMSRYGTDSNPDSKRKRSRTSTTALPKSESHNNASLDMISKRKKSNGHHQQQHINDQLILEIDNLRYEITNLKANQKVDQITAESQEKRLKRHIIKLERDAKEASNEATSIREESERAIETLNLARKKAMNEAREWREKFMLLRSEGGGSGSVGTGAMTLAQGGDELGKLELVTRENHVLQKKMNALEQEISSLRSALLNTSSNTTSVPVASSPDKPTLNDDDDVKLTPLSPAPPAVLSELNRTRVKLAQAECNNRQLQRNIEESQTKLEQFVTMKEKANNAQHKIESLEDELKQLRRERESSKLVEKRWTEFRKELMKHSLYSMEEEEIVHGRSASSGIQKKIDEENVPPEIATIVRQITTFQSKIQQLKLQKETKECSLNTSNQRIQSLEEQLNTISSENKTLHNDKQKLVESQTRMERELKMIQAQDGIAKREVSSMRSLLETYKQMEKNLSSSGSRSSSSSKKKEKDSTVKDEKQQTNDPTTSGLKISLDAANDQITLLRQQYEDANIKKDEFEKDKKSLNEENTRIRKKFEQLREALFKEKEKVDQAESRALEAETMAGKGSYNSEETRVLHLSKNPASMKVRERYETQIKDLKERLEALSNGTQIKELKEQLKALSSGPESNSKVSSKNKGLSKLEAQKISDRLTGQFRNQIALFREGVFLLTGFKVDMFTDKGRPRFTVRSAFAEKESDELNFLWPELKDGESAMSLDMLDTEMARALSNEPCFDYLNRCKSLPAFMASMCLTLFDRQTVI